MQKHAIAIMAAILVGGLSASVALAANHRHVRAGTRLPEVNATVRDRYVINGDFDWRRQRSGQRMHWYAHGYSRNCVAWEPNAYHYACDPNGRY